MSLTVNQNFASLDRRALLRWPGQTRGADGSSVETFTDGPTVWAAWLTRSSREFMAALSRHAEMSGLLRIRYRADVGPTWQASIEGMTYRLVGEPIEVGRREYLDLPLASRDLPARLTDGAGVALGDEQGNPITE